MAGEHSPPAIQKSNTGPAGNWEEAFLGDRPEKTNDNPLPRPQQRSRATCESLAMPAGLDLGPAFAAEPFLTAAEIRVSNKRSADTTVSVVVLDPKGQALPERWRPNKARRPTKVRRR